MVMLRSKSRHGWRLPVKVGDLVQNSFNQQLGVILGKAEVNGPKAVWGVLADGKVTKWQKFQMSVVNESR
jgi:hypothetical protein